MPLPYHANIDEGTDNTRPLSRRTGRKTTAVHYEITEMQEAQTNWHEEAQVYGKRELTNWRQQPKLSGKYSQHQQELLQAQ